MFSVGGMCSMHTDCAGTLLCEKTGLFKRCVCQVGYVGLRGDSDCLTVSGGYLKTKKNLV